MGQKVVEFVHEWTGVENRLAALCFDTTASNTGIHTGAITVVQNSFSRRLLFLACRHRMFEIYSSADFDSFFVSKGPKIDLFHTFKLQWDTINRLKFCPFDCIEIGVGCLGEAESAWFKQRCHVVVSNI